MSMKEYNIEISPAAERDLKDLKDKLKNFRNLITTINELSIDSRPYGIRKVKGFNITFRSFRYRSRSLQTY